MLNGFYHCFRRNVILLTHGKNSTCMTFESFAVFHFQLLSFEPRGREREKVKKGEEKIKREKKKDEGRTKENARRRSYQWGIGMYGEEEKSLLFARVK